MSHFPGPIFAWGFVAAVVVWMAVAAWYDIRTTRIPKQISVTAAILGLFVNIVRGVMLVANNQKVWLFDPGSVFLGALDGFIFALWGFLFSFILFTVIWILGACGGGDVKLMTAVGTWIGWEGAIYVLLISVVVVFFWGLGKFLFGGEGSLSTKPRPSAKPGAKPMPRSRVTFSASGLIATLLVMLYMYRFDLQLR